MPYWWNWTYTFLKGFTWVTNKVKCWINEIQTCDKVPHFLLLLENYAIKAILWSNWWKQFTNSQTFDQLKTVHKLTWWQIWFHRKGTFNPQNHVNFHPCTFGYSSYKLSQCHSVVQYTFCLFFIGEQFVVWHIF